jgi:hypothetical protein
MYGNLIGEFEEGINNFDGIAMEVQQNGHLNAFPESCRLVLSLVELSICLATHKLIHVK